MGPSPRLFPGPLPAIEVPKTGDAIGCKGQDIRDRVPRDLLDLGIILGLGSTSSLRRFLISGIQVQWKSWKVPALTRVQS